MTDNINFSFAALSSAEQAKQLERFKGICALYGYKGFSKLQKSHVVVIGTGGVGSWIAESLCRTGVGALTLVDFDTVDLSNSNRQLHAMTHSVGCYKVDELAARFSDINPHIKLRTFRKKLHKESIIEDLSEVLGIDPAELKARSEKNTAVSAVSADRAASEAMRSVNPLFAAEAIDDLQAKAACTDLLHRAQIPFILSGGAGGRIRPSSLRLCDVAESEGDNLIKRLRTELRRNYGYPGGRTGRRELFKILCSSSTESPVVSSSVSCDDAALIEGIHEETLQNLPGLPAFGASVSVTASAGLLISSAIIRWIVSAGD